MMTSMLRFFLILMLLGFFSSTMAQESETDPYSDYSYLWENSKKKKDKKKKQNNSEVEQSTEQAQTENAETNVLEKAPSDSLDNQENTPTEEVYTPSDSLDVEEIEPETTEEYDVEDVEDLEEVFDDQTLPLQSDSTTTETQETLEDIEETEIEETEVVDKKKDKKKSEDNLPIEDFRAPLASGGSGGTFNGGFTMTLIDDQYYAGLTLQPEFSIGKVGVGLNVPILYGLEDQKIRTEMFKDGVGIARLITYIRYGVQKRDPVYVKVGQLNNTMIGFGSLINNYTNSTSFEKRKVGLHYDINYKGFAGVEGMYSDFNANSFNLFAFRPYVRPLRNTGIPIVKTTEFGLTFIRDSDQTDIGEGTQPYAFTKDGVGAFGLDMGMTLLRVPFIQIDLFANYSRLNVSSQILEDSLTSIYVGTTEPEALRDGFDNGSGASVGVNFRFHFIANILSTDVRIERLSYSEHYLPQFFNTSYELNKDARILALGSAGKMSGIYGSLQGHILQKITLGGSLMIPDEISASSPAFVEVNANLERLADKITLQGSYFKGNLLDLGSAFNFDERSLAKLRVIYHLNKFMAAGLDYYWAFTPTENGGYEATKYVAPYFGVNIKF